jgi:hypothetical protein
MDEEEGLYALDCSGLVRLILRCGAPKKLSKVPVDSGHAQDTRQQGESGIGVGVIRFIKDEIGAPVSFFWSDRSKKPKKLPIAIGRALYIP